MAATWAECGRSSSADVGGRRASIWMLSILVVVTSIVPRLKVKDDTVITINVQHRVLKYDVIKKLNLWNYGFFWGGRGLWENNIQKAYFPKISIPGHIVFEKLAKFWWLHANPSKFDSAHNIRDRVKFGGICMESSEQNGTSISETICSTMLVFGK